MKGRLIALNEIRERDSQNRILMQEVDCNNCQRTVCKGDHKEECKGRIISPMKTPVWEKVLDHPQSLVNTAIYLRNCGITLVVKEYI
jgi:hypothetical protein